MICKYTPIHKSFLSDICQKKNYRKNKSEEFIEEIKSIHDFLDRLESGDEIKYSNCTFNFKIDLSNYVFKTKVRFHNCIFEKEVVCKNTTFNELVDFYQSTFKTNQIFHLTDFLDISIFSETTFEKGVIFRHNKISNKTYISFEKARFKNGLDISNSNFWCTLQVYGINVDPFSPSKDILNFYKKHYVKKGDDDDELNKNMYLGIRESFRRIKQEFRKNENHINALDFHAHEMTVFKKELFHQDGMKKKKNQIILYLNSASNDFGKSWVKGVYFTFVVGVSFYMVPSVYYFCTKQIVFDINSVAENLNDFINYFHPLKWMSYKPYGITNHLMLLILYMGKIFIGYGYYQTIQAFRKYGKN